MGSLDYRGSAGVENGPSQKTGTIDAYNVNGHNTARLSEVIRGAILCVTVMQAGTEAYEGELLSEPECVVSSAMRKSFFLKPRRFKARNLPSSGQERQLTTTLIGEPM